MAQVSLTFRFRLPSSCAVPTVSSVRQGVDSYKRHAWFNNNTMLLISAFLECEPVIYVFRPAINATPATPIPDNWDPDADTRFLDHREICQFAYDCFGSESGINIFVTDAFPSWSFATDVLHFYTLVRNHVAAELQKCTVSLLSDFGTLYRVHTRATPFAFPPPDKALLFSASHWFAAGCALPGQLIAFCSISEAPLSVVPYELCNKFIVEWGQPAESWFSVLSGMFDELCLPGAGVVICDGRYNHLILSNAAAVVAQTVVV